jgi:putative FmdB family regulatory protein
VRQIFVCLCCFLLLISIRHRARIRLISPTGGREVAMPHYEFVCKACKKTFTKTESIAEHDIVKVSCPHCGSHEVEQCWSTFTAVTSKKSA